MDDSSGRRQAPLYGIEGISGQWRQHDRPVTQHLVHGSCQVIHPFVGAVGNVLFELLPHPLDGVDIRRVGRLVYDPDIVSILLDNLH